MKKENYTVADFVADKTFRGWALQSNNIDVAFWDSWIEKNPSKFTVMEEARQIVEVLELSRHSLGKEEIHANWQQLENTLTQQLAEENEDSPTLKHQTKKIWLPISIAASLGLLIAFGIALWNQMGGKEQVYYADFGQTKTIWLPDSSQVILNGNSEIRFSSNGWDGKSPREIYLNGEAYFDVKHLENVLDKRFFVHTPDISVEVLGTTFNVSHRTERTRVVLETGKVQLSHETLQDTIIMEPGDLVELTDTLVKRRVEPERYILWTEHKLIFDDTSLKEIAEIIANNYGLGVEIKGEEIAKRSLTGEAIVESVDDLIILLRSSLVGVKVSHKNNKLILESQH